MRVMQTFDKFIQKIIKKIKKEEKFGIRKILQLIREKRISINKIDIEKARVE